MDTYYTCHLLAIIRQNRKCRSNNKRIQTDKSNTKCHKNTYNIRSVALFLLFSFLFPHFSSFSLRQFCLFRVNIFIFGPTISSVCVSSLSFLFLFSLALSDSYFVSMSMFQYDTMNRGFNVVV